MHTSRKRIMFHLNGWLVAGILAVGAILALFILLSTGSLGFGILSAIFTGIGVTAMSGFVTLQPNTALVSTCFGRYSGIIPHAGFFWVIPFIYRTQKVSLRTANYTTNTLKVNDASGTPIEVAAAIVYRIDNPAASVLDVEYAKGFLEVQSEAALRALATHYPYEAKEQGGESLVGHSDAILAKFLNMVQERVEIAGIRIDEARFTHLAYAPEIAQAMLRKQQAEAVIVARHKLVIGAVSMVEGTLAQLEERSIVQMSDPEKARLVTNMMTVLLSEENASPVLNVSGS